MKKRLILLTAGLSLGLFLSEFITAHIYKDKYSFSSMVNQIDYSGSQHEWHAQRFRPSKLLGNELIPNSAPEINSLGMRDKEYSIKKPAGVFRIIVLGDSITQFGRWSDFLEDKLSDYGNIEVLNCAVAGWNLYNYYLYMKYKAKTLDADLTVLALCLNDIDGWSKLEVLYNDPKSGKTVFYSLKKEQEKILHISNFLFRKSYIYRILLSLYMKRSSPGSELSAEILLKSIKNMADDNIAAVIFPYLKPLDDYDEDERRHYRVSLQNLQAAKISYLDLHSLSMQLDLRQFRMSAAPMDKIHFNGPGNELIAEEVYEWMLKEGFLDEARLAK